MIQPITFITAGIFFVVLFLRYRNRARKAPTRTGRQRFKVAKLLLTALAVWMAINYSLQHTLAKMDGTDQDPTLLERLVTFVSK